MKEKFNITKEGSIIFLRHLKGYKVYAYTVSLFGAQKISRVGTVFYSQRFNEYRFTQSFVSHWMSYELAEIGLFMNELNKKEKEQ